MCAYLHPLPKATTHEDFPCAQKSPSRGFVVNYLPFLVEVLYVFGIAMRQATVGTEAYPKRKDSTIESKCAGSIWMWTTCWFTKFGN